jgi:biotin transport system substrate-specific component
MELTRQSREWIVSLPTKSIGLNLFLAFAGAVLTAVCAQIIVPLPFTPVPMTMQVFAVLAIAGLLGPMYGGISQVIYITIGLVGMPWCAGGASLLGGLQLGVSAGYLAGFVAAAGLVGYISRIDSVRTSQWKMAAVMLLGLAIIYLFGG